MRAQERAHLAHGEGNALLGLLPGKHRHLGFRREHRGLHGDRVGMRRNVVGHDQHRRLAVAHEIARHREDEIGVGAVHPRQKLVDRIHADLGPALDELGAPALHVAFVEMVARLRARAARLRQHGRHHAIGRALDEIPDEGAADAEADHHELVDAEVIHHAEVVVGEGIPGSFGLERACGLAALGVAQVGRDATVLALELLDRVERRAGGEIGDRRVQAAAGDEQQRKAGPGLLVADPHGALLVEGPLPGRLRKHARRCRHSGRRRAGREDIASVRVHERRPPCSLSRPAHAARKRGEPNLPAGGWAWSVDAKALLPRVLAPPKGRSPPG